MLSREWWMLGNFRCKLSGTCTQREDVTSVQCYIYFVNDGKKVDWLGDYKYDLFFTEIVHVLIRNWAFHLDRDANKCISSFMTVILFVVTNTHLCVSHVQFSFSCFVTIHIQRSSQIRPRMSVIFKWMDLLLQLIALLVVVKIESWAQREHLYLCILQDMLKRNKLYLNMRPAFPSKFMVKRTLYQNLSFISTTVLKVKPESKCMTNLWHQEGNVVSVWTWLWWLSKYPNVLFVFGDFKIALDGSLDKWPPSANNSSASNLMAFM